MRGTDPPDTSFCRQFVHFHVGREVGHDEREGIDPFVAPPERF